jgi:hypothetical protein
MGPSYYARFYHYHYFPFRIRFKLAGALVPWKLIEIPSGELAANK